MPKTKTQKAEIVDRITDKVKRAKILVFTSFSRKGEKGLNFPAMEKLKKNLKSTGAEYLAVKKTLLDLALKKLSLTEEIKTKELEGSAGVLFGYEDAIIEPIKFLHKLSKENKALLIYFGLIEEDREGTAPHTIKKIISKDLLVELANLPSREILLIRLAAAIRYPFWRLASVLNQVKNK